MITATKLYLLYRQSGILTRHLFATTDRELAEKWKEIRPRIPNAPSFASFNGVTTFILADGTPVELLQKMDEQDLFINEALELIKRMKEEIE